MTNKKCKKWIILAGILGASCLILYISLYIYYTDTIKIKAFPEDGKLSPSGCYITKLYFISQKDSYIIDYLYYMPSFIKVFDAKTKECLYTSNIYNLDSLSGVLEFNNEICYGFLCINTLCKDTFIPPEEFEENE